MLGAHPLKWAQFGDRYVTRTKYTDFIKDLGLDQKFIDSGISSPKNFIKERFNNEWTAYLVVKRLEGK